MNFKHFFQITQNKNIEEQFSEIALQLFNNWALVTPKSKYRIIEIEFYYCNCTSSNVEDHPNHMPLEYGIPYSIEDKFQSGFSHNDPYTHCIGNQYKNDFWYIHSFKNSSSLKGGSRKGIDLTIGNENEYSCGGILIRGLRDLSNNSYINGPSKVVDKMIEDLGKNKVSEIASILDLPATDKNNEIYLEHFEFNDTKVEKNEIVKSQRIGLKKKSDDSENFFEKKYRFIIELNISNKIKDKENIVKSRLLENLITKEEAKNMLGYNLNLLK